MHQQSTGTPHHNLRFYIVMITLIVGGIFFLLYMNDSNDFSLTSAIIGVSGNTSSSDSLEQGTSEKTTALKNAKEVDVVLSFDQIPTVNKEAKVRDLELRFDDLTTKINVNNDKLELNNLQQVTLRLKDFSGNLNFDLGGFSLDGTSRSIEVNDIALSSAGLIKISFDNLDYKYLSLDEIELKRLELPRGDGELKVAEKLQYTLQQDGVKINLFNGKLIIDRDAETLLNLEGVARGISVSGALLTADLS